MRPKISRIVSDTFTNEANAIANLNKIIDSNLIEAILSIYNCKASVIVSGIGKSALVAKKIVATFNSTGTKAVFLHAGDALHGDVGVVNDKDIVLILSKSGNTPELKVLIPILKSNGNTIISISGNETGFLHQKADHSILFNIEREACPINLAPTTSTTVQMVIGDAIANALLQLRGFNSDDFLKFHPSGSLGKKLYLKVTDIMIAENLPTVQLTSPLKEVIIEMSSKRMGAVAVLNDNQTIAGIITDGDLRRMLEANLQIEKIVANDIMTQQPKSIETQQLAAEALQFLRQHQIQQLLVSDNGYLQGIIHMQDLLKEGIV